MKSISTVFAAALIAGTALSASVQSAFAATHETSKAHTFYPVSKPAFNGQPPIPENRPAFGGKPPIPVNKPK